MKIQIITLATLLLVIAPSVAQSQQYTVGSDYEMSIHGTSNMHDWTSHVQTITCSGTLNLGDDGVWQVTDFIVTIPVASIESEKGNIMDKKTMKALRAEEHPMITFQLTGLKGQETLKVSGLVQVAGVRKSLDMQLSAKDSGNNQLEISGTTGLKMTDFGIDPPTALMGALKVGDDVTVDFRVTLIKSDYNH